MSEVGNARGTKRTQNSDTTGASLTRQAERESVDINNIVRSYAATGVPPVLNPLPPVYGDFSNVPDFRTAIHQVRNAVAAFNQLPPEVRAAAGNDPARLLEMLQDPDSRKRLELLGLPTRDADIKDPAAPTNATGTTVTIPERTGATEAPAR